MDNSDILLLPAKPKSSLKTTVIKSKSFDCIIKTHLFPILRTFKFFHLGILTINILSIWWLLMRNLGLLISYLIGDMKPSSSNLIMWHKSKISDYKSWIHCEDIWWFSWYKFIFLWVKSWKEATNTSDQPLGIIVVSLTRHEIFDLNHSYSALSVNLKSDIDKPTVS